MWQYGPPPLRSPIQSVCARPFPSSGGSLFGKGWVSRHRSHRSCICVVDTWETMQGWIGVSEPRVHLSGQEDRRWRKVMWRIGCVSVASVSHTDSQLTFNSLHTFIYIVSNLRSSFRSFTMYTCHSYCVCFNKDMQATIVWLSRLTDEYLRHETKYRLRQVAHFRCCFVNVA